MKDAPRHTTLANGAEFDVIRDLVKRWGAAAVGIGDDASALELPRGEQLVVSVDAFVSGRHVEPDWLTAAEIGYRAAAAALSDLAAMGAVPLGVLLALNVPDDWRGRLTEIADGAGQAVRNAGTVIVGGNISGATELSITTTVLGHVFEPLTRRGAVVGDRLYVTGQLGGPWSALSAWKGGRRPSAAARERFAHPVPRIREARWLADHGATACIDISDGIVADARHLSVASGRQVEIHLERLPLISGVTVSEASRSGEEYELLVSAPPLETAAFAAALGLPLTEVGAVVDGAPGVTTLEHGDRVAGVQGHDHFSG